MTAIEDVTDVKRAEFANRLLARTGELLSHIGDYGATLEQVPRLLVPEFADWCSIEIPRDDGLLQRVATAHRDEARLPLLRELRERYPLRTDEPSRIGDVMRTGRAGADPARPTSGCGRSPRTTTTSGSCARSTWVR